MGYISKIYNNTKDDFFTLRGDKVIWYCIFALMIISLLVIYSSTSALAYRQQDGNTWYYFLKQAVLLGVSLLVLFIGQRVPYIYYLRFALLIMLASMILLVWASFFAEDINETGRWLRLGALSFQPSEAVKIATVIFMSRQIAKNQKDEFYSFDWKHIVLPLIAVLLIFIDNVSTALLLACVCVLMMIAGRLKRKIMYALVLSGLVTGIFGASFMIFTPKDTMEQIGEFPLLKRLPTVQSRILSFINDDPDDPKAYQSQQAKIAVAKGGVFGVGPGNSTQRNFLPHPYSDFIFAIILEEYGLIGAVVVLVIFGLLIFRIVRIVINSRKVFPALLVVGFGFLLSIQACIHMCVCVGIFPVTGQTLPFVSMGGTSTLILAGMFSIIIRVSYEMSPEYEEKQLELKKMSFESSDSYREKYAIGGEDGRYAMDGIEDNNVVDGDIVRSSDKGVNNVYSGVYGGVYGNGVLEKQEEIKNSGLDDEDEDEHRTDIMMNKNASVNNTDDDKPVNVD